MRNENLTASGYRKTNVCSLYSLRSCACKSKAGGQFALRGTIRSETAREIPAVNCCGHDSNPYSGDGSKTFMQPSVDVSSNTTECPVASENPVATDCEPGRSTKDNDNTAGEVKNIADFPEDLCKTSCSRPSTSNSSTTTSHGVSASFSLIPR